MRNQYIKKGRDSKAFQDFIKFMKIPFDEEHENYKFITGHLESDTYLRFEHPDKDGSEIKIGRDGKMEIERFPIHTEDIKKKYYNRR